MTLGRLTIGVGLASVLVALGAGSSAEAARPSSTTHYEAVVPQSNDLEFGDRVAGKRVPVPPVVARLIQKKLSENRQEYRKMSARLGDVEPPRLVVRTFELRAPKGRKLYVVEITDSYGWWATYYPILVSADGLTATRTPPSIFGKWLDGFAREKPPFLLRRPLVYFKDLDGDGTKELVFETYAHNGTMYNAAEDHYYRIEADMALMPILVTERIVVVPSDSTDPSGPPILVRKITRDGKNKLRINVYLSQLEDRKERKLVGYYVVARDGSSLPYRLVSQDATDSGYKDILVTMSDEKPAKYVSKGYTFFY